MAIPTGAVWNCRSADGSDNNGGFFVPGSSGTDYSQQASAQYTPTGLSSSGAGATILYSGAAAVMVGNGCNITAGTNVTTGYYEIVSVSVGVSITLDRAACTGTASGVALNIGGALQNATTANANMVAGNVCQLKGTFTFTSAMAMNFVSNSSGVGFTSFIGYTSTYGDGGNATFTTSTNSINIVDLSTTGVAQGILFGNITWTNTAGTVGSGATGNAIIASAANCGQLVVQNCSFSGFNVALQLDWQNVEFTAHPCHVVNTEIKNCVSHGIQTTDGIVVCDCYIHNNGGDGLHFSTSSNTNSGISGAFVWTSVFYSNGGVGISQPNNQSFVGGSGAQFMSVINCAFVSNTGDGIAFPNAGPQAIALANCIFSSNGGYGVNNAGTAVVGGLIASNAFYNNTSGARNNFPASFNGDVTLTGSPFTNPSGGDFTLNNTSGAGAACRGAGFPTTLP